MSRDMCGVLQIRFFERVKLERRVKQLKRMLEQAGPSSDAYGELQAKLHQATEDLQVCQTLSYVRLSSCRTRA